MYNVLKNNLRSWKPAAKPDVYVFSYGGTGTRMLCKFIQQHLKLNSQPHVHHGNPEQLSGRERAIYLYGDPIDAVLSFYRRDVEYETNFVKKHYRNLDVSGEFPKTFEDYLTWGSDAFCLEAHFEKYRKAQSVAGLVMVRFDDIWDHLGELFDFIRLPARPSDFPPKRARLSKRDALKPDELAVLEKYFSGLIELQASMEPIHYVSKGTV